jgi:hypothetical protein
MQVLGAGETPGGVRRVNFYTTAQYCNKTDFLNIFKNSSKYFLLFTSTPQKFKVITCELLGQNVV